MSVRRRAGEVQKFIPAHVNRHIGGRNLVMRRGSPCVQQNFMFLRLLIRRSRTCRAHGSDTVSADYSQDGWARRNQVRAWFSDDNSIRQFPYPFQIAKELVHDVVAVRSASTLSACDWGPDVRGRRQLGAPGPRAGSPSHPAVRARSTSCSPA